MTMIKIKKPNSIRDADKQKNSERRYKRTRDEYRCGSKEGKDKSIEEIIGKG